MTYRRTSGNCCLGIATGNAYHGPLNAAASNSFISNPCRKTRPGASEVIPIQMFFFDMKDGRERFAAR